LNLSEGFVYTGEVSLAKYECNCNIWYVPWFPGWCDSKQDCFCLLPAAQGTKISIVWEAIAGILANDLSQSKLTVKAQLHWQILLHYHR
jgi:hypothetical protein